MRVPLLLNLSSKTVNKSHVKSWGREMHKRKTYRQIQRVYIMGHSHNAKIWLAYVRNIDNVLSTLKIHVTFCMNISLFENRKLRNHSKSKCWNCILQAMMFLQFSQKAIERVVKLSLAFLPSICKIELGFHLKPDIHLKHCAFISKHVNTIIFLLWFWVMFNCLFERGSLPSFTQGHFTTEIYTLQLSEHC